MDETERRERKEKKIEDGWDEVRINASMGSMVT